MMADPGVKKAHEDLESLFKGIESISKHRDSYGIYPEPRWKPDSSSGDKPVTPEVPKDEKADRRTSSDATPAERKRRATVVVEELESEYGAVDLSKLTDSELAEADNLRTAAQNLRLIANEATAPLEQKHREQLRNVSRRIDEEMARRVDIAVVPDRRADLAARASALGDKSFTPGRLNQRIRTVEKHLKGVEERIQARKARGLNPTKAQLRDQADLKGQLKELNARKSGGDSGKA